MILLNRKVYTYQYKQHKQNKLDHLHVPLLNLVYGLSTSGFIIFLDLISFLNFIILYSYKNVFALNDELKHLLTHTFNLFTGNI